MRTKENSPSARLQCQERKPREKDVIGAVDQEDHEHTAHHHHRHDHHNMIKISNHDDDDVDDDKHDQKGKVAKK